MIIFGRENSHHVRKVVWCARELGVDFTRVDVGGHFAFHDCPNYLEINATGLVPTINDGGYILWESGAIIRYLCEAKDGGSLYPSQPKARGTINQWYDWASVTLLADYKTIYWQSFRLEAHLVDRETLNSSLEAIIRKLKIVDSILTKNEYLTGGDFTIADIALAIMVHTLFYIGFSQRLPPSIIRWYEVISLRQPFKDTLAGPLS